MRKISLAMVLAGFLAGYGAVTWARGADGPVGGMASEHLSSQGLSNTNGPLSSDRDKGQQRAEDRMSAQGATHEKATRHKHPKHHKHSADKDKDKDRDSIAK